MVILMRVFYETDHFPNEIRETKLERMLVRLYQRDKNKAFQVGKRDYNLNANIVRNLVEGKGVLFRVCKNGSIRYRSDDHEIDRDQVSFENAWIAPNGDVYPTFYQGHIRRAYTLQEEGVVPSANNPSVWLQEHGWISITEYRLQLFGYQDITAQQIATIKEIVIKSELLIMNISIEEVPSSPKELEALLKKENELMRSYRRAKVDRDYHVRSGFRDGD